VDLYAQVVIILETNDCHRLSYHRDGIWFWKSPRRDEPFPVDPTIPSKALANEILKKAGLAPHFV
jgi:hypothetical protein